MALIKCPECGKEISDKAGVCPECGYPISQKPSKMRSKKVVYVCCTVVVLGLIVGCVLYINVSNNNKAIEYYNQAFELYQNDKLTEAKEVLKDISDYKDTNNLLEKIENRENEIREEQYVENYYSAVELYQNGNFTQATEIFNSLPENLEIDNETIDIEAILENIELYKQCVSQIIHFSKSLKDPDSLEIKEVHYSAKSEKLDKNVVYITYKATNSFGGFIENTACIQDGEYIGEQYKDLGLSDALIAYDQSQELNADIVQNGLSNYDIE